jgi:hypothetical protein
MPANRSGRALICIRLGIVTVVKMKKAQGRVIIVGYRTLVNL